MRRAVVLAVMAAAACSNGSSPDGSGASSSSSGAASVGASSGMMQGGSSSSAGEASSVMAPSSAMAASSHAVSAPSSAPPSSSVVAPSSSGVSLGASSSEMGAASSSEMGSVSSSMMGASSAKEPASSSEMAESSSEMGAASSLMGSASSMMGTPVCPAAGFVVTGSHFVTHESGGRGEFRFHLTMQPPEAITISFTVSPSREATIINIADEIALVDPGAWDQDITVQLQGLDDGVFDGDAAFTVAGTASDSNGCYQGVRLVTEGTNLSKDRRVKLSADTTGALGGVAGADALCAADGAYKALLVDGSTRVAPGMTGNGTAWVLKPGYRYWDGAPAPRLLFSTDSHARVTLPMNAAVGAAQQHIWTGLATDWSTATNTCGAWSTTDARGRVGAADAIDASALSSLDEACMQLHPVLCVQQ